MKKLLILLLLVISLFGCNKQVEPEAKEEEVVDISNLTITVPSGAPSLAFYNEIANPNFSTGDAKSIMPELTGSGKSDIIVIDTVNGVKALNGGANYKLAATITSGNFYVASTGHDEDKEMNPGDYIVVFAQGATSDLVFHYLFGTDYDENLHYVNAVSDASACLIKGVNIYDDEKKDVEEPYVDYVFVAQPALFAAMKQNENISVTYNVQDLYKEKSGQGMIQASVFVSNNLDEAKANAYLEKLEADVNALVSDPSLFVEATKDMSDDEVKDLFGVPNANIANAVIKQNNAIGLGYKKAIDNKDAIDAFLNIFGVEKTSEEIYFK